MNGGVFLESRYFRHNRRKYNLKAHIVIVTKYRKKVLKGTLAEEVKRIITEICIAEGNGIVALETDRDHVHILISYDTTDRLSDIVKGLKQKTTHILWENHPDYLRRFYWKKRIFWSDGYFACSIGDVSTSIIQKYIETQG